MKRKYTLAAIGVISGLLFAGAASAAGSPTSPLLAQGFAPTVTPCALSAAATPNPAGGTKTHRLAVRIAQRFCVPVDEIEAWHDQGMGFGELGLAYALAEASGLSAGEIIARHRAGEGWGAMAHSLGFQVRGGGANGRVVPRGALLGSPTPTSETMTGQQAIELEGTRIPPGLLNQDSGRGHGHGNGHGNGNGHGGGNGNGHGHGGND